MNQPARSNVRSLALLLIWPAFAAMALQLYATSHLGPGLAPDSAVYLQGARQLASGSGYRQLRPSAAGTQSVPITWYPPAYSLLLAGGMSAGIDVVQFARLSSAALLGASVSIGVGMVWWVTRSGRATFIAGSIIGLAPEQLEAYAYALSEPMFIASLLAGLACLARYLSRLGMGWLLAAGALISLAAMTRYVGLLAVPFGVVAILVLSTRPPINRLRDAAIFGILSAGPNLLWILRNRTVGGSGTGRRIEWHPVGWTQLQSMFRTFTEWLVPSSLWRSAGNYVWWIAPTLALLALILAWGRWRRRGSRAMIDRVRCRTGGYLTVVLLTFSAAYLTGLLLSMSFVDAATPMDFRTLSPLFIPLAVPAISFGWMVWRRSDPSRPKIGRFALIVLLAVVVASSAWRSVRWSIRNHSTGERLTYASRRWQTSVGMELLRWLPADVPIWTNASDAVYLNSGRVERLIPSKYHPDGKRETIGYPSAVADLRSSVFDGRGIVVYFAGVMRRPQPLASDLDSDLRGLKKIELGGDCIFYASAGVAALLRPNPQ